MALFTSPLFFDYSLFQGHKQHSFTSGERLGGLLRRASPVVKIQLSARATMRLESGAGESRKGAAILWYKNDLRIDDHPGFVAASKHPTILPLYVFDRRIVSRLPDEMLELLIFALEDLRKSLKDRGSNLMIRFGDAEGVIEALVKEVKATNIYAEEEVEYHLCIVLDAVQKVVNSTALSSAEGRPRLVAWNCSLYDNKSLEDLPASNDDFKKLRIPVVSPVSPNELPDSKMDFVWGDVPSLDDLRKFVENNVVRLEDEWTAATMINERLKEQFVINSSPFRGVKLVNVEKIENESSQVEERKRPERSAFITQQGTFVAGGTSAVLNALAAYLRYLEGTARGDWQELHVKLCEAETREGASFGALFGPALQLGIISRRRVYYEAIKYEKERNGGFLSPFGYSAATISAAIDTVCSMEWYRLLALKSQVAEEGTFSVRIWRWNGYLIHYTVSGEGGPAILLVHGFGAFLDHFRDNIGQVAESGNRVWAMTLVGFGKSEKPNIVYTEIMWAKLVRDFIIEVVGEPVHLVGNSIGGYFVAIAAGLWPAIAKSVVLVNSAGNVTPEPSVVQLSEDRQTSGAAWLGARLLLLYLRLNIRSILKSFYPAKMERVDDQLIYEMLRASHDPGVLVVLECIFGFDLSLPLNSLLKGFEGKILVVQGMRDPLSDSRSKLAVIREHCKGIAIRELDAGHCPHDELPAVFNAVLKEWVLTVESEVVSAGLTR
ncbi:OLC1v1027220C1 [Oldenlandia corymbosa var. corymbosa]|uniref:OLC1v1027220C1 n=1 Tax=Oldenlandia corymbosa var. corymbosa TaxID=529605 RepID=A0AAV1CA58_OLDCO|nr:OLC1v1027220C1 [Oldenlandia corymbosa var. corymbosa]